MDASMDVRGQDSHAGEDPGGQVPADLGRAGTHRHRAFHRPVTVQTGRLDRERVVSSTRDAAAVLLRDWPVADAKRARAMELCLRVIKGEKQPHVARRAFIEAAREARVLIED